MKNIKQDNREIKFRLFGKNSKEFLGGTNNYAFSLKEIQNIEDIDSWEVSQFTGLLDYNGKSIWEGDIVVNWVKNGTRSKTRWSNKRVVEFKEGSFGIRKGKCYEVIGNIYENKI
jgi:hypothetical protein